MEFMGDYLDAINALDPPYRDPYRFADTLLVLLPEAPKLQDYLKGREVLERGTRARPYDTELWFVLGQYLAYLARPWLPTAEMKAEWKLAGARALSRACELASRNGNIPHHCVAAATLFDAAGEREAAIDSLNRLLAVTDDPEIERLALGYLERHLGDREKDRQRVRRDRFRSVWKEDLPFVEKDFLLVLGPRVDTARCAGAAAFELPGCFATWKAWAEKADPDRDGGGS